MTLLLSSSVSSSFFYTDWFCRFFDIRIHFNACFVSERFSKPVPLLIFLLLLTFLFILFPCANKPYWNVHQVSLYKTLSIRTQGNPFSPRHLLFVCYRRLEWLPYKHHYVSFNLFSSPCLVLFHALFISSILCHIWSHLNTEPPIVYFSILREWLSKRFRLNRSWPDSTK